MRLVLLDRRPGNPASGGDLGGLWGPDSPLHPVIGSLGLESWRVNLVLVTDQAMAGLNQDYRRKAGVTDVLSFPYLALAGQGEPILAADRGGAACALWNGDPRPQPDSADEDLLVGEVVLAPGFVLDECRREGRDVRTEFMLLVIHGCLHLLGWDHGEPERQKRMRIQERLLLEQLGLVHPLLEGS